MRAGGLGLLHGESKVAFAWAQGWFRAPASWLVLVGVGRVGLVSG